MPPGAGSGRRHSGDQRRRELLGVLCVGQLLNRRTAVVDRIKAVCIGKKRSSNAMWRLFRSSWAASASPPPRQRGGDRAVGTLIAEDVYKHVLLGGERWIRPGYIVDDWYLTAYERSGILRAASSAPWDLGFWSGSSRKPSTAPSRSWWR